jgi:hypothetical protein
MAKPKIAAPEGALAPAAQVATPEAGAAGDQALPDVVDAPNPAPTPILIDKEPTVDALPDLVKARVLVASSYGQPNDVIEIDAELAKTLPDVVDTSPAAVAYAESLADEQ